MLATTTTNKKITLCQGSRKRKKTPPNNLKTQNYIKKRSMKYDSDSFSRKEKKIYEIMIYILKPNFISYHLKIFIFPSQNNV